MTAPNVPDDPRLVAAHELMRVATVQQFAAVLAALDWGLDVGLYGDAVRPLSVTEMQEIQQLFVAAARRLVHAGYDGVEIHAGNG